MRVVGKAREKAVSEGPKEVAKKNKTAHMLHAWDRARAGSDEWPGAGRGVGMVGPRKRASRGGPARVRRKPQRKVRQLTGCTRGAGNARGKRQTTGRRQGRRVCQKREQRG
jgi:hypothetical protein